MSVHRKIESLANGSVCSSLPQARCSRKPLGYFKKWMQTWECATQSWIEDNIQLFQKWAERVLKGWLLLQQVLGKWKYITNGTDQILKEMDTAFKSISKLAWLHKMHAGLKELFGKTSTYTYTEVIICSTSIWRVSSLRAAIQIRKRKQGGSCMVSKTP